MMIALFEKLKGRIHQNLERERKFEKHIDTFSRKLWPYSELRLILYVGLLPILDWLSTFIAIELSGKNIREVGLIGRWALQTGGFSKLFLMEMTVVAGHRDLQQHSAGVDLNCP